MVAGIYLERIKKEMIEIKRSTFLIIIIIVTAWILQMILRCPPVYSLWNIPENLIGEKNNTSEEFGTFIDSNKSIEYKIGEDWVHFPHKLYRQPHNPHIVSIFFDTNDIGESQNFVVAVCTYSPSRQILGLYLDGHCVGKQNIQESYFKDITFYLGKIEHGEHLITIVNETDPDPDPFSPRYGIFFDYIQLVTTSGKIINIPDDYPSITNGIQNANPGDIIQIEEGEYSENRICLKSGLTLMADNPHETIINGGGETVIFGAYKSKIKGLTLKTTGNIGLVNDYDFMYFSNNIVVSKEKGIYLTGQNFNMINNTIISSDCCIYIRKFSSDASIPSITCRNNILSHSNLPIYIDADTNSVYGVDPYDTDQVIEEFNFNAVFSEFIPYLILSKGRFGNIYLNPSFIDPNLGDYHLMSFSPCIDAGDPNSDYSLEPEDNGKRINIGAYGNTPWATRTLDSDEDGVKDFIEFSEDEGQSGLQYWLDSKNALFRASVGDKSIKISLDSNEGVPLSLKNVRSIDIYESTIADVNIPTTHLLYGLWGFSIKGVNRQDSVVVDIHFPDTLFDVIEYIAYDQDEGWKPMPIKIDSSRSIVSIELIEERTREREEDGEITHIGGVMVPYPFHADLHSYSCFISGLLR